MMTEKELNGIVDRLCNGKPVVFQNGVMALSVNIKLKMGWLKDEI